MTRLVLKGGWKRCRFSSIQRFRSVEEKKFVMVPMITLRLVGAHDQLACSARINSAAFSAIIIVGAAVLPDVMAGITDASTTRKPATPRTLNRASVTAAGSLSVPIFAVPT